MNGLSIGDGFKFGCGFFMAGFVAWIFMVIVTFLLTFVITAVAGDLLQDIFDTFGLWLPMLAIV